MTGIMPRKRTSRSLASVALKQILLIRTCFRYIYERGSSSVVETLLHRTAIYAKLCYSTSGLIDPLLYLTKITIWLYRQLFPSNSSLTFGLIAQHVLLFSSFLFYRIYCSSRQNVGGDCTSQILANRRCCRLLPSTSYRSS